MHKTSKMKYFGESWGADICFDSEHVPTPVGQPCGHCGEDFEEGDRGIIDSGGFTTHLNCFLRPILGSVAHIQKQCSCYIPGATCGDPPGMTKRQAADAAVRLYYVREYY
jgi:hypothetical protein